MLVDLFNNLEVRRAISPVQVTDNTAEVGEIIDMANRESLLFVIGIGTLVDADATFTVLVEDGDNASLTDNAAVADAFLLGTEANASFTFANDDEVRKIGYIGPKRYVRMTITPASNTGLADLSVVAVLGGARVKPRSSESA
jgi:hypothetical protein